uniref:HTH OST-type domain-containing protein n=1 Tax=Strongyloides papillosus TaxID=174720 RepID=A0A0N5CFW9_STREA
MSVEEAQKIFRYLKSSAIGSKTSLRDLKKNYSDTYGPLSDDFNKLGLSSNDDELIAFLKSNGSVEITKEGRNYYVSFEVFDGEKALKEMIDGNVYKKGKKGFKDRNSEAKSWGNNNYFDDMDNYEASVGPEITALYKSRTLNYYQKLKQKSTAQSPNFHNQQEPKTKFGETYRDEFYDFEKDFNVIDKYYDSLAENGSDIINDNNESKDNISIPSDNNKIPNDNSNIPKDKIDISNPSSNLLNNMKETESNSNKNNHLDSPFNFFPQVNLGSFGEKSLSKTVEYYNKTPKLRKDFRQMISNSLSVINVMERTLEYWEKRIDEKVNVEM